MVEIRQAMAKFRRKKIKTGTTQPPEPQILFNSRQYVNRLVGKKIKVVVTLPLYALLTKTKVRKRRVYEKETSYTRNKSRGYYFIDLELRNKYSKR